MPDDHSLIEETVEEKNIVLKQQSNALYLKELLTSRSQQFGSARFVAARKQAEAKSGRDPPI